MASTDDPGSRVSEIAAQTVALFVQESLPQIMRAINVRIKAEFGGEQVHFRKDSAERNALRNEMIRRDLAAGMPPKDIQRKYRISRSRLYQIRDSINPQRKEGR